MNNNLKILIIEDDKYISNFLNLSLKNSGYDVFVSPNATNGLFVFSSHHPDLILLDLGLPDMDGLEIIKEVRLSSDIPIIIVSARTQEKEKIEALDLGASDYITKPFHLGELLARIRVAERGINRSFITYENNVYECDYLNVDFDKRRIYVGGQEIHLTPIEYKLLQLLIQNQGKVLTHNYIIKKIWGYEGGSDTKGLRVFMANLRRKIEKDSSNPRFIMTEVGVGYRFADE